MLIIISGGSGSGKSEYAENIAVDLRKRLQAEKLIYIAAMKPYGDEALKRIERHRSMRSNKGFETMECYFDLESINIDENSVALLECMSNLAANEIFENKNKNAVNDILNGIKRIENIVKAFIIVTNEIFSDGVSYDRETVDYIKALGYINRHMFNISDAAAEIVCGAPVYIKGGEAFA